MMRYKKLSINSSFISFYQNSHAGNCSARLTSLKSPFSKEKKISIWYLLINYWIVLGQHTLYWKASLPLNSQKILHPWLKRHDLNQSHPLIQHANLYRQIHPSRWCGHLLRQNERPKFPWRVDIQDQVQRVEKCSWRSCIKQNQEHVNIFTIKEHNSPKRKYSESPIKVHRIFKSVERSWKSISMKFLALIKSCKAKPSNILLRSPKSRPIVIRNWRNSKRKENNIDSRK